MISTVHDSTVYDFKPLKVTKLSLPGPVYDIKPPFILVESNDRLGKAINCLSGTKVELSMF